MINVTAAIMERDGKILIAKRSSTSSLPNKWEFPGGKIENNESFEEVVRREIQEELMIAITSCDYFMTVEHQYPDFFLTMHSFVCDVSSKEIVLTEHIDSKWLEPAKMPVLDWAAADIPIIRNLLGPSNEF